MVGGEWRNNTAPVRLNNNTKRATRHSVNIFGGGIVTCQSHFFLLQLSEIKKCNAPLRKAQMSTLVQSTKEKSIHARKRRAVLHSSCNGASGLWEMLLSRSAQSAGLPDEEKNRLGETQALLHPRPQREGRQGES